VVVVVVVGDDDGDGVVVVVVVEPIKVGATNVGAARHDAAREQSQSFAGKHVWKQFLSPDDAKVKHSSNDGTCDASNTPLLFVLRLFCNERETNDCTNQ
jgi:hypothetical protein